VRGRRSTYFLTAVPILILLHSDLTPGLTTTATPPGPSPEQRFQPVGPGSGQAEFLAVAHHLGHRPQHRRRAVTAEGRMRK